MQKLLGSGLPSSKKAKHKNVTWLYEKKAMGLRKWKKSQMKGIFTKYFSITKQTLEKEIKQFD